MMLKDLECKQAEATKIMCDNSSSASISKNLVFHGHTKHIKIKFHFIRTSTIKKSVAWSLYI